jgi:endoglucanase
MKSTLGCLALTLTSVGLTAACHNEPAPQTGAAQTSVPQTGVPAPQAAGGGGGGNAPPPGPTTVSDKECPADFTIDDAEDNNNQVLVQKGRKGYWYTFIDKAGSSITPPAGSKFLMSPGGAKGSLNAARMMGKMSSTGDPLYAGMGFSFTDPKGPYDATAYTGVSFYAKIGPNSTKAVRLKVPDGNTDPAGKVCTECFNDFGEDLTLTEQWQKYTIPFATMKQMEGWGSPHPATIDKSKLFGLQWQVTQSGATYDVWVDNVQFTGCP